MRRIAISWLILCAALCALLQMQTPASAQCDPTLGVFNCRTLVSGGGGCSQATTFLARTSGLSGTETTAYTNMICGMITDGVGCSAWSGSSGNLDALYIFATNTTTTANLNLCSTSFSLTKVGSVTFSADHGYTGDGSTGYFTTGLNPCAGGLNASQNSESIGAYSLTSRTSDLDVSPLGVYDASDSAITYLNLFHASGTFYDVNGKTFPSVSSSNSQGSWIASRTSSSLVTLYKNGSSLTSSGGDTSFCVNLAFFVLAANSSGSPINFTTDQTAAILIGGGVNSTQAGQIQSRINTYMTALGINVY